MITVNKRPIRYLDNFKDEMDKFIESQIFPNIKYIKSFFEDRGFVFRFSKEDTAFIVFMLYKIDGKELYIRSCFRLRLFNEEGFGYYFFSPSPTTVNDKDGNLLVDEKRKSDIFRISSTSDVSTADIFEKNFFTYIGIYDKYKYYKDKHLDMFYGESVF